MRPGAPSSRVLNCRNEPIGGTRRVFDDAAVASCATLELSPSNGQRGARTRPLDRQLTRVDQADQPKVLK